MIGNLNVDRWQRVFLPKDKSKKLSHAGWFEVFYQDDKVVQITTTLEGYKTKENLSVNSAFQAFEKQYGETNDKDSLDFDWDRPAGSSHDTQSYWDFKKIGLRIESKSHNGDYEPTEINAISVHPPNRPYLFISPG